MDWWGPLIWGAGLWCKEWIPVVAPTGVFFVALVAYKAYRQRLQTDKRDQWWKRAQWAIDAALDSNEQVQFTGLQVLTNLKTDSLATPEDVAIFDSIAEDIQEEVEGDAFKITNNAADVLNEDAPDHPLDIQTGVEDTEGATKGTTEGEEIDARE